MVKTEAEQQRVEFKRLVSRLDAFNYTRALLVLARYVEVWRYPVDVAQRVHLARQLWQRRN